MDSKEIKAALKEARDAIKNKDFKTSLKLCKAVLKADRNNYVGLVLFGATLQETELRDQAPNAFKKAIEASPKQILAWQGLASFYEKEESESSQKALIPVYGQLMSLESDASKFSDLCDKLVSVALRVGEESSCVGILQRQEQSVELEQQRVLWKAIVALLLPLKNLPCQLSIALESTLSSIIEDGSFDDTEEYFKKYLRHLYKQTKYIKLLDEARKMHSLYPRLEYPLEWICKVFSEQIVLDVNSMNFFYEIAQDYCDKLTALNPDSSMALFAKGAELYRSSSVLEACDVVKQVCTLNNSSYVWALLCQCHSRLHCHLDAESCAMEALAQMEKLSSPDPLLETLLHMLHAKALCYQEDKKKWMTAIDKCKKIYGSDRSNRDALVYLARTFVCLDSILEAEKCISVLEVSEGYWGTCTLLNAMILKKTDRAEEALERLTTAVEREPSNFELCLELGKLHWDVGNHDLCLRNMLKATKLDPNCYLCFVYLGRYYSLESRDLDKARRCFQKAFQLNPRSEEAGAELSDVYRLQKQVELNVELLSYLTQQSGLGGGKWAWLRLGLHHQEEGNLYEAVSSLQSAVRSDPNDSHCWESLADAYSARGSFTAALKSYQRVVALDPNALYPAFQVATIKQVLGQYEESVEQYEQVVKSNPQYVPALKGLAETCLLLARQFLSRQLIGRCQDLCQEAADNLTTAVLENRALSCLWKLFGDVCTLMGSLPDTHAQLSIQEWLMQSTPLLESDEERNLEMLEKDAVLQLGNRCYCRALSLSTNNSLIWQDLAVNYMCQADYASITAAKKQYRSMALTAAKKCVLINPKNWQHWNILGIVVTSDEIKDLRLSQHAFIKAIQLEANNPVAWTNLGTLYLCLGELNLANKSFAMAQRMEPTYIECWIGQALLAERTNFEDTMDLFRHTTELGVHRESSMGYAHWVCTTLLDATTKQEPHYKYSIEKMHAVPVAGDAMTWYTASVSNDPCAYNMLGLLMERQQLYATAAEAFGKVVELLEGDMDSDLLDRAHCNYARVLVQLKHYPEAIQNYLNIKQAKFESQCGLAAAYFKAEMYQDSYTAYESILHWLAPDDGLKSHVLVAMAAMAYKIKGVDDSKTLLFQCVQLKPPSVQGLFASCALGMLHGDLNLSEIVLKELVPHKDNPIYMSHIAVFKAYTHFLQRRSTEAIRSLSTTVHRHPGEPSLWLALALLILNLYPQCKPAGAARCAQVAMALGQSSMDVSKVMSLVSLSHLLSGKAVPSLRSSQKAVHMFPDIPENWVVLIASFLPWCMLRRSARDVLWLKQLVGHVRRRMDATRQMGKWLSSHERKVALLAEEYTRQG